MEEEGRRVRRRAAKMGRRAAGRQTAAGRLTAAREQTAIQAGVDCHLPPAALRKAAALAAAAARARSLALTVLHARVHACSAAEEVLAVEPDIDCPEPREPEQPAAEHLARDGVVALRGGVAREVAARHGRSTSPLFCEGSEEEFALSFLTASGFAPKFFQFIESSRLCFAALVHSARLRRKPISRLGPCQPLGNGASVVSRLVRNGHTNVQAKGSNPKLKLEHASS